MIHKKILMGVSVLFFYFGAGVFSEEKPAYLNLAKQETAGRFDWLIGDWTYSFENGEGQTTYRKVSGGAIMETLHPGRFGRQAFTGTSLFLPDTQSGNWKHHWMDTMGTVLQSKVVMEAYEPAEGMAMVGYTEMNGTKLKHVWYNITPDRFETDLLVANTDGSSYNVIRRMPFLRKK